MRTAVLSLLVLAASAADGTPPAPAPATMPAVPPAEAPMASAALRLEDVMRIAGGNAAVQVAKAEQRAARASYGAARRDLLPNLDGSAGGSRGPGYGQADEQGRRTSPETTVDASVQLSQAILDPAAWDRARAASLRADGAEAARLLAREDACATAASAFVSVLRARALVAVRRDDLALAEELLALAKTRVDAGAAEAIVATRSAVRVAESRAALAAAEGSAAEAAVSLARSLSLPSELPPQVEGTLDGTLAASRVVEDDSAVVMASTRPEVAVQERIYEAARADAGAASGARWGRLEGFASAGRIGPRPDDTEGSWRVGLRYTVPLIGRAWPEAMAAREREQAAVIRLAEVRRQVEADVRSALAGLGAARARLVAVEEGLSLAKQEVEQARTRYTAGAGSHLELVEAQRGLASAAGTAVDAREAVAQARIRLARAAGQASTLR